MTSQRVCLLGIKLCFITNERSHKTSNLWKLIVINNKIFAVWLNCILRVIFAWLNKGHNLKINELLILFLTVFVIHFIRKKFILWNFVLEK